MALIHHANEIPAGTVALKCHKCGARYTVAEVLAEDSVDLYCLDPECHASGMIGHGLATVDERFPDPLPSRFTPMPDALRSRARELGIGANEIHVIEVLESHRWGGMGEVVYPSLNRIADLALLSRSTVVRSLAKLTTARLIEQTCKWGRGRKGLGGREENRYSLDPLWNVLAAIEQGVPLGRAVEYHGAPQPSPGGVRADGLSVTVDEVECQTDPRLSVRVTPEVDTEKRETKEEDPAGARGSTGGVVESLEKWRHEHEDDTPPWEEKAA